MKAYRHIIFGFLTLVLFCSSALEGQTRKLKPETILKKSADRYATYSSYQDEGVVITTYHEATGGRIDKLSFKLFFSRPNRFRFEWLDYYLQESGLLKVVWSDGADAFVYWEPDRYEKKESLELIIAGATGISGGSAYTIPRLLIPAIEGWALTELTKTVLVGEEIFEGEVCYRIKGFDSGDDLTEIWISKTDFLIRKVTTHSTFETFSTVEDEIHRNIKTNQPIAKTIFAFKPPIALSKPRPAIDGEILYAPESLIWSEFKSAEGRFELLMPATPVSQTVTLETQRGTIAHHIYVASRGGVTCIVDYADLPKWFADPGNANAFFDEARNQVLKESQGKLASEKAISLDGHSGREVTLYIPRGHAVARFYLAGDRFYQLGIIAIDPKEKVAQEADKFFSSFKIINNLKPAT